MSVEKKGISSYADGVEFSVRRSEPATDLFVLAGEHNPKAEYIVSPLNPRQQRYCE